MIIACPRSAGEKPCWIKGAVICPVASRQKRKCAFMYLHIFVRAKLRKTGKAVMRVLTNMDFSNCADVHLLNCVKIKMQECALMQMRITELAENQKYRNARNRKCASS
jgi:hypothetical protein